nr:hypothetical protein [Tanacetum cinerariifolium]
MGRVGPTTASSTPEILTIQYFPNQASIYTPTTAYATHRYGTSLHQEYLLVFTSEYGISEAFHPELPCPEERIVDFPEGKQEAREKYPSMLYQAIRFPKKLEQPLLMGGREGIPDYYGLAHKYSEGWDASREYVFPESCDDTKHTSHPNPETTRSTPLLSRVEPQILLGRQDMDLFSLIRAPNPTKVKAGTHPRVAHEVPLWTVTASWVIEKEDPAAATDSPGVPSTIERSPLDFANENPSQQSTGRKDQGQEAVAPEVPPPENVTTTGVAPEAGQAEGIAATGPHVVKECRKRGNNRVDTNAPPKVLRRDHVDARPTESTHGGKSLAAIGLGMGSTRPVPASQGAPVDVSDPDSLSFADPQSRLTADIAQERPRPEIQNKRIPLLPPWSGHPKAFTGQNKEAKLLKKFVAQVAHRDKRIQAKENEIKNLETLLEAEIDMKKATKGKSAELSKELENLRALFSDLQRSQVAGRKWVIGHGLRLAVMKCDGSTELRQAFADVVLAGIAKGMSDGLKHGVEHRKANLSLEAIEAYDPEAEAKYIAALHALKDLKYPIVDQLESLKDAPMDVIMSSLHLESDTRDDAPQWIHELRPCSSQLTIPVYPEARNPTDPWACKEEILLADAIAANVSRAEKKKKCRVVCRTHGVGSTHHTRSDGNPVSVPTIASQGLAILLADAATQTEISEDGASPRLLRSSSLPVMNN